MPDRVVNLALATYIDPAGLPRYGLQGETVTVHPDHVDRFDELNVDMGPPAAENRVETNMIAPGGTEKPQPQPRKVARKTG